MSQGYSFRIHNTFTFPKYKTVTENIYLRRSFRVRLLNDSHFQHISSDVLLCLTQDKMLEIETPMR